MSTESVLFSPAALPPHPANRLAVFIDIENFAGYCADMGVPVDIAPVLEHLSQHHGRIQIKRSFGDVSSLPGPAFNPYRIRRMLQAHQIDHLDIPHRPTSYSKNSADIRLVVEAVALIHQRPEITHIVVVSNDRDFIPLFNHAREHGKLVIGCGPRRANVNEDYRNACDVFVFHEDPGQPACPGCRAHPACIHLACPRRQARGQHPGLDRCARRARPARRAGAVSGANRGRCGTRCRTPAARRRVHRRV